MASEHQPALDTLDTRSLELILPRIGQSDSALLEDRPLFLSLESLNLSTVSVSPINVISLATVRPQSTGLVENHTTLAPGLSFSNSLNILQVASISHPNFAHKVSESLKVAIGSYYSLSSPSLTKSLSPSQLTLVESGEMCAICLEEMLDQDDDIYTITECKHRYHEKCIRQWKIEKSICPLCRGPLPDELGATKEENEQYNQAVILARILRCLPSENEGIVTRRWKIINILLTPLGIAWLILIMPIVLVLETLFLCILPPILMVSLLREVHDEIFYNCCNFSMWLSFMIMLTLVGIFSAVVIVFIVQIPFLMYVTGTFCFNVFTFKRRWQDAFPYIMRRVIFGSLNYYLLLD